jgi:DNA invertase Pin-like site-specific DNA recombinase
MKTATYEATTQVARQRALRALANLHPEEFARLHNDERRALGLDPPDMARWRTPAQLPDDEVRALYESGLSLATVAKRFSVSGETIRRRLRATGCVIRPLGRPPRSGRQP